MAWFTTPRDRLLWLRVAAAMACIYATLGLAGSLAGALAERELVDAAYALSLVLVLLAVAARGLSGRFEVAVVVGSAALAMLVLARLSIPVIERTHLIEYGVVGLLVHDAILERRRDRSNLTTALFAVLVTGALGAIDELIQAVLPNRVFDPRDMLFNLLAGLGTVSVSATLLAARRRRDSAT